ncbi:MAG: carbon-nitrogen hydrolase family protein, partial [Spirochaetales bacterium]|nr:carbon-nitrogen hydrolase family protein [Spirochaetales bacterium]
MKQRVCVFQPGYSVDLSKSWEYIDWELEQLDKLDGDVDIAVLPEGADILGKLSDPEQVKAMTGMNTGRLLAKVSETARRCNAIIFVNCYDKVGESFRNTTFAFDRNGEVVGKYYKQHLTWGEEHTVKLDASYTYEYDSPYVLEIDGIMFAFLTCYDFYFFEEYANIAKENVDIIIGCSQQKSDRLDVAETFAKFLAYNCNAFVLRSGVTLNDGSELAGGSLIASPAGRILANLRNEIGITKVDIDTDDKLFKPGGFGNPDCAHWQYV